MNFALTFEKFEKFVSLIEIGLGLNVWSWVQSAGRPVGLLPISKQTGVSPVPTICWLLRYIAFYFRYQQNCFCRCCLFMRKHRSWDDDKVKTTNWEIVKISSNQVLLVRLVLRFLTRSSLKFQEVRASFRVKRFDCVTPSKSLLDDYLIEEPTSKSSEFVTQAFEVLISGNWRVKWRSASINSDGFFYFFLSSYEKLLLLFEVQSRWCRCLKPVWDSFEQ